MTVTKNTGDLDVRDFGADPLLADNQPAIQAAVDHARDLGGGKVVVPPGRYQIKSDDGAQQGVFGVQMRTNVELNLSAGAELKMLPTATTNAAMVVFRDSIDNAHLTGYGKLIGDRDDGVITVGEFHHNILISLCTNVSVSNVTTRDAWGDGVGIGQNDLANPGTGLPVGYSVDFVKAFNNRRQGMSIGGGTAGRIHGFRAEDTLGTPPGGGIDLEPVLHLFIKDLVISDFQSINNVVGLVINGSQGPANGIESLRNVQVIGGQMCGNSSQGVTLHTCDGVSITGTDIRGSGQHGVYSLGDHGDDNNFNFGVIADSNDSGVWVQTGSGLDVSADHVVNSGLYGLAVNNNVTNTRFSNTKVQNSGRRVNSFADLRCGGAGVDDITMQGLTVLNDGLNPVTSWGSTATNTRRIDNRIYGAGAVTSPAGMVQYEWVNDVLQQQ